MSTEQAGAPLQVGDWIVEANLDTISRAGETQKLEPRTMRLLLCLIHSAGSVVSIERLLNEVWSGVIVSPASVYQAVSQLRKILGDTDPEPTYIATVPRKGYRLVAAVRPTERRSAALVETPAAPALPLPTAAPPPRRLTPRSWPIALSAGVLLIALAALWLWKRGVPPADAAPSIAVLPFVDLTAERADQPFCDGLTEELSNWLAQIPALRVVARTSAFAYRGQAQDVRKIGRQLDTNHILEGSMRRSGDHLRVTVQLIDARSGYHLWSQNYDQTVNDTIKMQEDISRSVAENLQVRLTPEVEPRFTARRSQNPQAYQAYLLARHYQHENTAQSNERALQLYRQALSIDPKFSLAYVGVVYALLNQNWLSGRPISDIVAEAEPLLSVALKLEPDLSDIYDVRGALRAEQSQDDAALLDFEHAIRLNPNDAQAFSELGRLYLANKAQPHEAVFNYTRAAALDPVNYLPQAQRCLALQDLGEFAVASASCARARSLQPQAYWPLAVTAELAAAQGRLDEALKWNQLAIKQAPDVVYLYRLSARWLITLGLPQRAREVMNHARTEAKNEEALDEVAGEVAYAEGGAAALRHYLENSQLEAGSDAANMFSAAYFRFLISDAAAAAALVDRALKLPDAPPHGLAGPYEASHGHADEITVVLADLYRGDKSSAARRLDAVSHTLDQLARHDVQRFEVEELRAKVQALRGDADGALASLTRAAARGWRDAWWAQRQPEVSSLWARTDFRALSTRVNQSNEALRQNLTE